MKSRIYSGRVMHVRHVPVRHAFGYPCCFLAVDLGELPLLDHTVVGFGHNRWRPASLRDADYLLGGGELRTQLGRFVPVDKADRIVLVTMARFLARTFNPVSFYLGLQGEGSAAFAVAEVNNTFGERHFYAMPGGPFPLACRHDKQFHVSPFNDMVGHYEFSFTAPGEQMRIGIRLVRDGEAVMDAAMWGRGREITSAHLWAALLRHPFDAALTLPRILWNAALLHYKKKLPLFHKPDPSSSMTIKVH